MKVIIYTDGSARSNPGRGGYGAVPWMLAGVAAFGAGAFLLAVRDRG